MCKRYSESRKLLCQYLVGFFLIAPLTKFSKQYSMQDQGNTCRTVLTCTHVPFQSNLSFKIQMAALSEIQFLAP